MHRKTEIPKPDLRDCGAVLRQADGNLGGPCCHRWRDLKQSAVYRILRRWWVAFHCGPVRAPSKLACLLALLLLLRLEQELYTRSKDGGSAFEG